MSGRPRLIFLTHPEVQIDPNIPVPRWHLSSVGRKRVELFARSHLLGDTGVIFSSDEQKAIDAAVILSERLRVPHRVNPELGENDRSATGYLPPVEFEAMTDRFFAEPERSVSGWERAVDAQARIVRAVRRADERAAAGKDLLVVAHGGVGALLLAHVCGQPISRALDQPGAGGGSYLILERGSLRLVEGWLRIPRPRA